MNTMKEIIALVALIVFGAFCMIVNYGFVQSINKLKFKVFGVSCPSCGKMRAGEAQSKRYSDEILLECRFCGHKWMEECFTGVE